MSSNMTSHGHRLLTNHLSHNLLHIHIEISLHSQLSYILYIKQCQLDDTLLIMDLVLKFYMYSGRIVLLL